MLLAGKVRTALRQVDEAVFPPGIYCVCCGSLIDSSRTYGLCDTCIRRFHWNIGDTCSICGKALRPLDLGGADRPDRPRLCYDCMREERAFRKGFSCLTYGLHERELMMALKYNGSGFIAVRCGDMMFDRIEEEIRDGLFSPWDSPVDIVTPVPVSTARYRKRGYNQSALMARQLVRRWREFVQGQRQAGQGPKQPRTGCGTKNDSARYRAPVLYEELLERTRKTKMLRGLSPAERVLELQGAFGVRTGYSLKLQGKRVLLIDDIYTTGATADACSRALLEGGAAEVFLLAWASGGNRRPGG